LWAIGYVLGIIAFMVVPANLIGWVVSPIGILITLWVLIRKIGGTDMLARHNAAALGGVYYLKVAVAWTGGAGQY